MGQYRVRYGGQPGLDVVTYLIIINIIVFVFMLFIELTNFRFFNTVLEPFFVLVPGEFLSRPWTLLTHMFLHAGIWHLISNMLGLYFFGEYLRRLVGERMFFFIYFIGGIIGGLFFLLFAFTVQPELLFRGAVGASGAIYALGGALAVLQPKTPVMIIPFPIPIPLWIAVVIGLLVIAPGIAWQAHLGGAVFGALIGLIFRQQRKYN